MEIALPICGVMPALWFRLESPQCTQSAVPSEARLIVVVLLLPAPDKDPAETTALFVRLNVAVGVTPATLAVTVKLPALPLAMSIGEVARPLVLVTAVAVSDPPKLAPAPLAGVVNVTGTPFSGLLPASMTVACRRLAKAVLLQA